MDSANNVGWVLFGVLPVPPPERAVIADADNAVAVAADPRLPDGCRALRVAQDVEATKVRIRGPDVPDVRLADLEGSQVGLQSKNHPHL